LWWHWRFSSSFAPRRFSIFINTFFAATLVALALIQYGLGGFVASGNAFSTALLIPLAASLLLNRRATAVWAALFLGVYMMLFVLNERAAAAAPDVPPHFEVINGFFSVLVLTSFGVSMILYLVRQLARLHERADNLLYNMMPRTVASRLKENPGTIAEHCDSASVMFADIVGFTELSTALPPADMVALLNRIYSHLDGLAEKHGVEKIRTIGDNYMAAAGVTSARPDHAQALARMALEALAYCDSLELVGGEKLAFRVGINSGPLMAGVVGTARLQFDIWGDAVNTASRMESHGLPGRIQVTEATYRLLKDTFALEPRGTIEVKGKGPMETWFVKGADDRS
jgi:adenylate cyclase